jgi:hypothetical protein
MNVAGTLFDKKKDYSGRQAAMWTYLLRLRMAIPMHRASPPYNTKQPTKNIIHPDNGILHSPYT